MTETGHLALDMNIGIEAASVAGQESPFMLEAHGVSKSFAGLLALDKVDISISRGSIHGLIGPNGSGKSTFFNVVTGILPLSEGRVALDAKDVTRLPAHMIASLGVARTFQGGLIFPTFTCLQNVMCGMHSRTSIDVFGTLLRPPFTRSKQERRCAETASDALNYVGLGSSALRPASDLVWVERQLLQIARALVSEPQMILLDEPTSGMGDEETGRVADIIKRVQSSGKTVLVISHDVRFVTQISDVVTVLSYGKKICEGSPQEVQNDPKVLEVYLGTE